VVREVGGRIADILFNTRRQRVHPFRLMLFLQRLPKIIRYKIIQRRVGHVECLTQVTTELDQSERAAILRVFREALGDDVQLDLRIVKDLPPEPSGKHRFLVNLVDRDSENLNPADNA
jgi:phenylacetate-CoA ligase